MSSDSFNNIDSSRENPTEESCTTLEWRDLNNTEDSLECCSNVKLDELEEEHELLSASLFALTTHFAQVQLRLRQIVSAPVADKQHLLKSLEEFAFRGVCDMQTLDSDSNGLQCKTENFHRESIMTQRKQLEIIEQLQHHLKELELFVFSGEDTRSSAENLLHHQGILDDLRNNLEEAENGSASFTNLKMKQLIISQLKTQIVDLERFVEFLQGNNNARECTCACPVHGSNQKTVEHHRHSCTRHTKSSNEKEIRSRTIGLVKRATELLQMFIEMQLGCGMKHFKSTSSKMTKPVYHWGDLRAYLEIAVAKVEQCMRESMQIRSLGDQTDHYSSETEDTPTVACDVKLTTAVRKDLSMSLRKLMEHGLVANVDKSIVVPFFVCFPKGKVAPKEMHAWELILSYYHLKNGEHFNSTPARKLSQSFNLDIVGNIRLSQKQSLLSTIGMIIATHSLYKRSYDSHFKAFICAALNANKLVTWLNLILQCRSLIETYYTSWSYVARTGFQDSLQLLDHLTQYKFDLPVDLAVRHFQNIKDIFM